MRPDWQLIIYIIIFVLALGLSIVYGIWYFKNCAFVPALEAPGLCFANGGR